MIDNIELFWKNIKHMCCEDYIACWSEVAQELEKLSQWFLSLSSEQQLCESGKMEQIGRSADKSIKYLVFTFLLKITNHEKYAKKNCEIAMEDKELTKENKYFIFYQVIGEVFRNITALDTDVKMVINQFYKEIYLEYLQVFKEKLIEIPEEERNTDVVIVFISQFLSIQHGPTKTVLDRCYVLSKKLHKKVWLINTAEQMSTVGFLPIFRPLFANYVSEWCDESEISYKGETFRFFQCIDCMPNDVEVGNILDFVKRVSPSKIFYVGGASIVMDLCDKLVPGMVINTVPSDWCCTQSTYQMMGRKMTQQDKELLKCLGKLESHVIECRFTSTLQKQKHIYSRADLNIPEGRFTVLIVGARLDQEIKQDFVSLLSNLMKNGIFVVFMGEFGEYNDWCSKEQIWIENSRYLGFVSDVLAVNECCDLYLNPIRTGGGTSVVEAFYKGLPAITCPVGDVAVGAGEEFIVENYEEMEKMAIKYANDKEFYKVQSEKAKERAQYLMDSESVFPEAIKEMERREGLKKNVK